LKKLEAIEYAAAKLIQRLYRGFRGRKLANLKIEFLNYIKKAEQLITIKSDVTENDFDSEINSNRLQNYDKNINENNSNSSVSPSHIDNFHSLVNEYLSNHNFVLPIEVLIIFRSLFYLFYNDDNIEVGVNIDGYYGYRVFSANTLTWANLNLIIHRKGKFLRLLKSRISTLKLPNPKKMNLCHNCIQHCEYILQNQDEILANLTKLKSCTNDEEHCNMAYNFCHKIYYYIIYMYQIYKLQDHFPDYFVPGKIVFNISAV
jgi:hypothetical protein